MTAVFADTFALIAQLNRRDPAHAAVARYLNAHRGTVVTTEWVLVETADALSAPSARASVVTAIRRMRADPRFDIVPYDPALAATGFDLFAARPDKAWSLTDCISFTVMTARGLADALTADHHFTQAGFRPVFAAA